jgi:hypothetical protein
MRENCHEFPCRLDWRSCCGSQTRAPGKRRRRGIFVIGRFKMDSSSVGAAAPAIGRSAGTGDFAGVRCYQDVAPAAQGENRVASPARTNPRLMDWRPVGYSRFKSIVWQSQVQPIASQGLQASIVDAANAPRQLRRLSDSAGESLRELRRRTIRADSARWSGAVRQSFDDKVRFAFPMPLSQSRDKRLTFAPTALRQSAQGWSGATTLGGREKENYNPNGVAAGKMGTGCNPFRVEEMSGALTQGSACRATLG